MAISMKVSLSKAASTVNYLEFHNTKNSLPRGTYRVVEADGSISYAALGEFRGLIWFDITWYTEEEYEQWMHMEHRTQDVFFDDDDSIIERMLDKDDCDDDHEYNDHMAMEQFLSQSSS
jgi:hypothetical protein